MLVIDLCSWAASIYSGETRLNELKERHCSKLARQRRWGIGDGEWIEQHYDRSHSEAFARLFPGISGETPSESDVDALRSRLQKYYKPLDRDRNENRAHRYENRNHPARAPMLDFERLSEFFEFSRQLIVDLRLVADGSQLGFDDVSPTRAEFASPDIVDLVLLGSFEKRQSLIGMGSRADLYARLHAAHEAAGDADMAFNDGRFLYPDGYFSATALAT
jgi:hypothetical protein